MRPLLFILLVLAILFLLAGATIALIALRTYQREGEEEVTQLSAKSKE